MTVDYKKLMAGVRKDDKEEQDRRMKPVYDEVEIWRKDPAKSIPYATTRIKQAISQFTGLVSIYYIFLAFSVPLIISRRPKPIVVSRTLRSAGLSRTSEPTLAPKSSLRSGGDPMSSRQQLRSMSRI